MKSYNQNNTFKSLVTATAVLGFVAVPLAFADKNQPAASDSDTDTRAGTGTSTGAGASDRTGAGAGAGNRTGTGTGTVAGTDRTPLTTEVTQTFVEGYTVPSQYQTHFMALPAIEEDNVVVHYQNGRAYYVNSDNWTIKRVVELDPSIKLDKESSVFVEGYMIPEAARTRFIEVPKPEGKMTVRYYNNTAYYMDDNFRIVRTVKLSR